MRRPASKDGRVSGRTARAAAVVACAAIWLAGPAVGAAARPAAQPGCGDAVALAPVRLHLIDRAGLSGLARDELRREAVRPWLTIGAVVDWTEATPQPAAPGGVEDLYVIATGDAAGAGAGGDREAPLASIRFVDGRPTTYITVYAGALRRRLDDMRVDDRRLADRPPKLRDHLLGRALGRAVAHELGHFLLASRTHAAAGVMRASLRLDRLVAVGDTGAEVLLPAPCVVARLDAW